MINSMSGKLSYHRIYLKIVRLPLQLKLFLQCNSAPVLAKASKLILAFFFQDSFVGLQDDPD